MPPMGQAADSLLQRQRLLDLGIDVAAGEPVVAQLGPAVQVDGGDDAHVGLAPLAAAVGDLRLEELERVQAQLGLWDLEPFAQDGGGFVLHEEEGAVGFVFGDLLHDAEVGDCGEEVAVGESGYGRGGKCRGRVAEFVDYRVELFGWLGRLGGGG